MATQIDEAAPRLPLTRERVLQTAVALADRDGVEGVSMRKIAQELGGCPWRCTSTSPARTNCSAA